MQQQVLSLRPIMCKYEESTTKLTAWSSATKISCTLDQLPAFLSWFAELIDDDEELHEEEELRISTSEEVLKTNVLDSDCYSFRLEVCFF